MAGNDVLLFQGALLCLPLEFFDLWVLFVWFGCREELMNLKCNKPRFKHCLCHLGFGLIALVAC
ncbi:hypothetical protein NC652_031570 [Populus alba x Populus x berolinensis]|nr:hypothetical protein NC652_031570 [Populus alba x Populus x berolinensis]